MWLSESEKILSTFEYYISHLGDKKIFSVHIDSLIYLR